MKCEVFPNKLCGKKRKLSIFRLYDTTHEKVVNPATDFGILRKCSIICFGSGNLTFVFSCLSQQQIIFSCPQQQHVIFSCPLQQQVIFSCPQQQQVSSLVPSSNRYLLLSLVATGIFSCPQQQQVSSLVPNSNRYLLLSLTAICYLLLSIV